MPSSIYHGNEVQITTEEIQTDARQLFYDEITGETCIVLSVEDNRVGLLPKELDMVFQPIFSLRKGQRN